MPGTKEIKRRIKLVKSTSQITRAMELVAATKMRKAEADARATREYAARAEEILMRLSAGAEKNSHPLLERHSEGKTLAILIAPDRGLAGALPGNLFREVLRAFGDTVKGGLEMIVIGRKGQAFARKGGFHIIAAAERLDWKPHITDIRAFAKLAVNGYLEKKYKQAVIAYTKFLSASAQKPAIRTLLPFLPPAAIDRPPATKYQYLIEPSPRVVLDSVLRNLVEMQIFQALLEANASEHSARMIAMHSATQNAKDLNADLTLSYNHIRQEGITR